MSIRNLRGAAKGLDDADKEIGIDYIRCVRKNRCSFTPNSFVKAASHVGANHIDKWRQKTINRTGEYRVLRENLR
jgi:hypothetical protein